jgi:hypothetical protein
VLLGVDLRTFSHPFELGTIFTNLGAGLVAFSCETLGQSCKTLDLEIWTTSYRAGFIHLHHYFESLHFTIQNPKCNPYQQMIF